MTRLFVSHSSADNIQAERVRRTLHEAGYESTFLDFDPDQGLQTGQHWQSELFEHIRDCAALVFVGSDSSEQSKWCHTELALARWLRKPVIPLRLPGTRSHPLLADLQFSELDGDDQKLRTMLADALSRLGVEQREDWDVGRSPYPGLLPMSEDYAAVFYGRDPELRTLLELVDPPGFAPRGMVIPVLGPSGAGKSSLVRAGLVPTLRARPDWVVLDPFMPVEAPLEELSLAMAHAAKRFGVTVEIDDCQRMLAQGSGAYLRMLRATGEVSADARLLIVVDQGEQLLTTTAPAQRNDFLSALAGMCLEGARTRAVMTVRTDYWDQLDLPPLDGVTSSAALHVGPMTASDLRRVVEEPAGQARIEFEPGLVDRIVEDTGSGTALPLLAYTLSQLATRARHPETRRLHITVSAYDAIGGVVGGIAAQADAASSQLGISPQVAARALLPLVGAAGPKPAGRRARASNLDESQRSVLDRLAEARLITIDGEGNEAVYTVAHEALFVAWPPLRELIEERMADLRIRDRLERQATDWRDSGKGRSGLLEGEALQVSNEWAGRSPGLASAEIDEFRQASQRGSRRRRLQRLAAITTGAILVLTTIAVLVISAGRAREQSRLARVGELLALAEARFESDPSAAAIALLEANRLDPMSDRFEELARQLLSSPGRDVWTAHDAVGGVLGGAVSTDAGLLLSYGILGSRVWQLATGTEFADLPVATVGALRPDGRVAALATTEGIELWDLGGGEEVGLLPSNASAIAFSADGSKLAAGNNDGSIELWDVSRPGVPTLTVAWVGHSGAVTQLSLNGQALVSIGADSAIRVWDESGIETLEIASGLTSTSPFLALGAGTGVAAVGTGLGPVAKLWNEDGSLRFELPRLQSPEIIALTWSGAFSADFSQLVTTDLTGNGTMYDTGDGAVILELVGHRGLVSRPLFVGSDSFVTLSLDGTVRRWSLNPTAPDDPALLRSELCTEFGPTFDEELWNSVIGDEPYQPGCELAETSQPSFGELDLPSSASLFVPPPTGATVFEESFDSAETDFHTGPSDDGQVFYSVVGGRYEVLFDEVAERWTSWSPVEHPPPSRFALSTDIDQLNDEGGCGLSLGTASSTITITADFTGGKGIVSMFAEGSARTIASFLVPIRDEDRLELTFDEDLTYVVAGADLVATLRLPELADVSEIGVAVSGSGNAACSFGDLVVRDVPG